MSSFFIRPGTQGACGEAHSFKPCLVMNLCGGSRTAVVRTGLRLLRPKTESRALPGMHGVPGYSHYSPETAAGLGGLDAVGRHDPGWDVL